MTRDIYQKKHRKVTITKKVIKDYLGRPVYEWEKDTLRDHVGIVHGLAWTAVGGVTLKIEVNVMPGKGAVQVTGSLGNVMKESAQAAISYIRSQSRKYKIKQDFFEKHDIHIHIPEPPSLVALPPMPMMILSTPSSIAALINCPVP